MNKKNIRIVIGIIAVVFLVAVFSFWPAGRTGADSGHRPVFGTFARIVAVAADSHTAKKCIEAGFEQFELIDNLMSDYKADSELSRVNREAYKGAVKVSEPLFEVLQRSVVFSRETGGAFDVTVGPLVDLFRSAEKKQVAPSKDQIAQAKLKVGFEKLKLDEQNRTVKFAVDGMRLDLGGIAKGYAVDLAVEAMQRAGAVGGMVDVGGDIRCFGVPPQGKSRWLIGLQDPNETEDGFGTGRSLLVLELTNAAIATSGDYRRFTLIEGKKYSHIIDARAGCSSNGLTSVTIISKNATDADALATAVSVMGAEKGLALIETKPETEAILISLQPKYELVKTSGAAKYISGESANQKADAMYEKYQVQWLKDTTKLEGKWGGEVWKDVESIEVKHFMGDEPEHKPKTEAKVLYDEQFIYVIFRVEDRFIRAVAQNYQDSVCQDSCVEFFFTPGADFSLGYFNIEINCGGTMLFNYQSAPGVNVVAISDSDCDKVKIYHSQPKIIEPEKQQPTTWVIEYRVPFDVLEKYCPITRPAPAVSWRANFYKCADSTSHPHWLTWSVVDYPVPNFHLPQYFGTLEFK